MTVSVSDAIFALSIDEWVLLGEPTNETEFNQMFQKVVGVDEQGLGINSSNPDDFGVTWAEVKAKLDELRAAEPLNEVRRLRNKKLAETDWWASSDLTMTQAQIDYRQALRDITDSATSLDDVTWPTKPE